MYYTVYRITNLINNKIYVGCHQTKHIDDGYMGSGKLILQAIKKYGKENFKKEILFIFDNKEEMFFKEKELVFIGEGSYNLKHGGHGGFTSEISRKGYDALRRKYTEEEWKEMKRNHSRRGYDALQKKYTREQLKKFREDKKRLENS